MHLDARVPHNFLVSLSSQSEPKKKQTANLFFTTLLPYYINLTVHILNNDINNINKSFILCTEF